MHNNNLNGKGILTVSNEQQEILNIAENQTNLYIQNSNFNNNLTLQMINLTTDVFNGVIPLSDNGNLYDAANSLPSIQTGLLDQLNNILTDNDESISSCINRINNIETQINTLNLTEVQQAQIYTATNTAKSSLEYWYTNIDDWSNLLGPTQISSISNKTSKVATIQMAASKRPFSWKKVAKGDAAGAVAGAAAWGGAWVVGGPATWSAFGISVGGWAAGCSAYEAIQQLW